MTPTDPTGATGHSSSSLSMSSRSSWSSPSEEEDDEEDEEAEEEARDNNLFRPPPLAVAFPFAWLRLKGGGLNVDRLGLGE